jgi:hypothetical protein
MNRVGVLYTAMTDSNRRYDTRILLAVKNGAPLTSETQRITGATALSCLRLISDQKRHAAVDDILRLATLDDDVATADYLVKHVSRPVIRRLYALGAIARPDVAVRMHMGTDLILARLEAEGAPPHLLADALCCRCDPRVVRALSATVTEDALLAAFRADAVALVLAHASVLPPLDAALVTRELEDDIDVVRGMLADTTSPWAPWPVTDDALIEAAARPSYLFPVLFEHRTHAGDDLAPECVGALLARAVPEYREEVCRYLADGGRINRYGPDTVAVVFRHVPAIAATAILAEFRGQPPEERVEACIRELPDPAATLDALVRAGCPVGRATLLALASRPPRFGDACELLRRLCDAVAGLSARIDAGVVAAARTRGRLVRELLVRRDGAARLETADEPTDLDIVRLLLAHGEPAGHEALVQALRDGRIAHATALLDAGAAADAPEVMAAVVAGHDANMLRILFEHGAPATYEALFLAIDEGQQMMAEIIIGADPAMTEAQREAAIVRGVWILGVDWVSTRLGPIDKCPDPVAMAKCLDAAEIEQLIAIAGEPRPIPVAEVLPATGIWPRSDVLALYLRRGLLAASGGDNVLVVIVERCRDQPRTCVSPLVSLAVECGHAVTRDVVRAAVRARLVSMIDPHMPQDLKRESLAIALGCGEYGPIEWLALQPGYITGPDDLATAIGHPAAVDIILRMPVRTE